MKKRLSEASDRLLGQPMFKVLAQVIEAERQGENIIHFEIGDPDFNTPDNITKAACESLARGETHYTSSLGLPDFRECIREATFKSRGFMPDLNQVLALPGANAGVYYAVRCLMEPGDEVIIQDPSFPTYNSVFSFCGVTPVRVPLREENQFRLNPDDLLKAISPKTRLIIINSPQNPTGAVMTKAELEAVADIALEKGIYLLSDEVYARMVFDENNPFYSPSIKDKCKERIMVLNGFSKTFAMTGWRIGAVLGPADVIDKMGLMLQTISSCVSPFIQRAAIEAIKGDQTQVRHMMAEYKERRNVLVQGLNQLPGVSCLMPQGAFYVFPNITGTAMDSATFAKYMLEEAKVALLPGTNFGPAGEGFARLCYATSRKNIEEGLRRMAKALANR